MLPLSRGTALKSGKRIVLEEQQQKSNPHESLQDDTSLNAISCDVDVIKENEEGEKKKKDEKAKSFRKEPSNESLKFSDYLELNEIPLLFDKLTATLLQERPDAPLDFIISWMRLERARVLNGSDGNKNIITATTTYNNNNNNNVDNSNGDPKKCT
ncbi:uncharacterized protein TEOVI_000256600 [Trypanosoma equiperdum]|uniref:Uncharacterized protein n=1 Tax=Trypanosoma equiperdum TaxID=5694 RepID=A0A1G4IFA7_TRYEQ|nr:hypothetical protein, conserved [Trypanosoma equiperdum]